MIVIKNCLCHSKATHHKSSEYRRTWVSCDANDTPVCGFTKTYANNELGRLCVKIEWNMRTYLRNGAMIAVTEKESFK